MTVFCLIAYNLTFAAEKVAAAAGQETVLCPIAKLTNLNWPPSMDLNL